MARRITDFIADNTANSRGSVMGQRDRSTPVWSVPRIPSLGERELPDTTSLMRRADAEADGEACGSDRDFPDIDVEVSSPDREIVERALLLN